MKPITMQEVRLVAGEGKLNAATVLQAVNVILKQRSKPDAVAQAMAQIRAGEPD
jgi:hypothetical protein